MAAKLPIIASRVGGIPEMVADGQNGCLVAPEKLDELVSACSQLIADQDARAVMGEEGWRTVDQKFNIERQVDTLEELYFDQLRAYGK
jgi:glycosyltransferase involved in cell wall biosynthesis